MQNSLFNHYIFFEIDPQILNISGSKRELFKKELIKTLQLISNVKIYYYSLLGLKSRIKIMFWIQSEEPSGMQKALNTILHTSLGKYLIVSYTLFGMVKKSVYSNRPVGNNAQMESSRLPYLIVYPFTKTKEWYLLSLEKRKELMGDHMKTGVKYGHIRQLLLYSFGIDDHEFVLSYEAEKLEDFQSLIIEMRSTEVRLYTENDLPIFPCIHTTLDEILAVL